MLILVQQMVLNMVLLLVMRSQFFALDQNTLNKIQMFRPFRLGSEVGMKHFWGWLQLIDCFNV